MHRHGIIVCAVIVIVIALSALRYIPSSDHLRAVHHTYDVPGPLVPEQRILLGEKIDINVADAPTFEALERVGPALAERIIEDRTLNGPFASIDDLRRVRGIGPKIIEKNRAFLTTTGQNEKQN